MKVLHLLASTQYSGAEHVVIDIIKYSQLSAVYVSPYGSIDDILSKENIAYIPLKKFSYWEIYSVIKKYNPDFVHAHDYKASCIVALMPLRCKIISHIHNNNKWAKNINFKTILYSICSIRFQKKAVVSEAVIAEFALNIVFNSKTIIIPNIINRINIERLAMKSDYYEVNSDFLFVGRLCEQKNPMRFVQLIKKISDKNKNVKAIIIGSGEYQDIVRAEICRLKLENNIQMHGFKKNPYKYMMNTKALLITSQWEGFGLVALEAMLLGKIVLTTNVGGVQKIVGDYNSNWVNEMDSGFIKQMTKILRDDKYADASKVKEYADKINDIDGFISKINRLYL